MVEVHLRFRSIFVHVVLLLTVGWLVGCSGSLRPLYRDFEIEEVDGSVYERIESALDEAGWVQAEASAPNVVATEARTVRNWGVYRIKVSLEILPMNEQYVRVMVHPYRHYFTGGRSKLSFMSNGLHNKVLGDLNRALAEHGFHMLGKPMEKDKELRESS